MKQESRTTKAIAALLRQTQEGTLKWQAASPGRDLTAGTDDVVETVYLAETEGRLLRLIPFKTQDYCEVTDDSFWTPRVVLELSDEKQTSWWRFPQTPVTGQLLEAVQFKTVDVDHFIGRIVSDANTPSEEATE